MAMQNSVPWRSYQDNTGLPNPTENRTTCKPAQRAIRK